MTTERAYERTHPWLTFKAVDLRQAPSTLWMLLGEAGSKIEHLRGVPLRPEATTELQRLYLAKGAWATTAIEGNTLSEEEVRARIDGTLDLPASQEYLGQEIDNVIVAFNAIARDLLDRGPLPLDPDMITTFNRLVLNGLELDPGVVAGEFRTGSVAVGPYKAVPAEDVPYLLGRLCGWLSSSFDPPSPEADLAMAFSIVKAIVAHVYFEWIHPFGDGNGRTGRLIEFQILLSSGVPFPAAHLLSNHYNQTRTEYYRQLQLASRMDGDLLPFLSYAVQGFVDGLRSTIQQVQSEQMEVMWENHVHHVLPGHTAAAGRRRTLVLELSTQGDPIRRGELMDFSPDVIRAYRDRGPKTLTRDLNELRRLDLVRSTPAGYVAAKEQVRAFLPARIGE